MTAKNLRTNKNNFRQFADPNSIFWAPPFIERGKTGNPKQVKQPSQSVARLWRPYQTWWGSNHPRLRSVVSLGHGVKQIIVRIDITSAVLQLATRCLILGVDFSGSAYPRNSDEDTAAAAVGTAPRRRLSSLAVAHIGWRLGVVASVVRRMNEVTLRRARLVLGWVTVFGRVYHHGM